MVENLDVGGKVWLYMGHFPTGFVVTDKVVIAYPLPGKLRHSPNSAHVSSFAEMHIWNDYPRTRSWPHVTMPKGGMFVTAAVRRIRLWHLFCRINRPTPSKHPPSFATTVPPLVLGKALIVCC